MAPYISHADAQEAARISQYMAKLIILNEYAGAKTERYQEILAERSGEQFTTHTRMLRKQRCQQITLTW